MMKKQYKVGFCFLYFISMLCVSSYVEQNASHVVKDEVSKKVMYLTFDEQTTSTGIKTRIEAFYDMLKMKKDQNYANIKEEKVYE